MHLDSLSFQYTDINLHIQCSIKLKVNRVQLECVII